MAPYLVENIIIGDRYDFIINYRVVCDSTPDVYVERPIFEIIIELLANLYICIYIGDIEKLKYVIISAYIH